MKKKRWILLFIALAPFIVPIPIMLMLYLFGTSLGEHAWLEESLLLFTWYFGFISPIALLILLVLAVTKIIKLLPRLVKTLQK